MVFSGMQPSSPPHHLAVQAPHFCRPQHHDTVHRRTVPTFRQQHGIAKHVIVAALKCFQNLRTVCAVPVHLCGTEPFPVQDIPEFLACLHKREKHHRLPVHAVFLHYVCDLVQIRIQRSADISCFKIPGLDADACQV